MSLSRKILFSSILLGLASVVFIPATELALRIVHPGSRDYLPLVPNSREVFNPQYSPGIQGPSVYQVNSIGVRARELSGTREEQLRILAVGGSTTEGLVTDQARVWTQLLEDRLGVRLGRSAWVGNVGRSGLNSRHHAVQIPHLAEVYDPDMIIVLVGVNDFIARLSQHEAYDPDYMEKDGSREALMRRAFKVHPNQGIVWAEDPWYKRTRLWGLMRTLKHSRGNSMLAVDSDGDNPRRWAELRYTSPSRTESLPSLGSALAEYERNLEEVAASARSLGVELVLMTQPTIWRDDLSDEALRRLWMGGIGEFRKNPGSTYYTEAALAEGMHAYNLRLLEVAERADVRVIDLATEIPKTTDYFDDDCHFTDEANRLIADVVAASLLADQSEEVGSLPTASSYRNP